MLDTYNLKKQWVGWSLVRAHACTLAVGLGFNSWWRVPRDAFRFGGLAYALAHTVALLLVAMPVALLHLAVGQLSQQDAVGIWRAVPFFRGVGYLRLLVTSLGSIYTSVYLALVVTNLFYTMSSSNPSWECTELIISEDIYETSLFNSSLLCYNDTILAPVAEQPESYVAIALIIAAIWIVCPLMLYSPVKFMKRIFYVLGPVILILFSVIVASIGDWNDLLLMQKRSDWPNFLDPDIWYAAFIQALWSAQIAGGFLITSGDTIYFNTNVQWTTLVLIAMNIASSWFAVAVWFAISGSGEKDQSMAAVLFQVYNLSASKQLNRSWPLVIFTTLLFSGIISMITLLYPLYDRIYRVGGSKWRILTAVSSLFGGGAALAVLAGRLPVLHVMEGVATPLLISFATVLEMSAFVFIYGWKILVEDIEFLTGQSLSKYWVMGWCAVLGIMAPFSAWWAATLIIQDTNWSEMPWEAITLIAATGIAVLIFLIFAGVAVVKQVQYDFIGKLKSSFKPTRHWGPRDPITHYYWLARREEAGRGNVPRSRYHRRHLGQLSGTTFVQTVLSQPSPVGEVKRRTNSDDWIYTVQRRRRLEPFFRDLTHTKRRRSKSLDWEVTAGSKTKRVTYSAAVDKVAQTNVPMS